MRIEEIQENISEWLLKKSLKGNKFREQ